MSINLTVLGGRITVDPELKKTATGLSVVDFNVACDRRKRKNQEKAETDFFKCIAFENTADFIARYIKKGDGIMVQGHTQNRNYTNKDGIKIYVSEVIVDNVTWFPKAKREEQVSNTSYQTPATGSYQRSTYQVNLQGYDSNVLVSGEGYRDVPEDINSISSDDLPFY